MIAATTTMRNVSIAVASSQVTAGQTLRFRLTGPDDTDYVVTLDGVPVDTVDLAAVLDLLQDTGDGGRGHRAVTAEPLGQP